MEQTFVYRLDRPDGLAARADLLKAQLTAALDSRGGEERFYVSPVSGCFRWFASDRRRESGGALPPAEKAIRSTADQLAAINGRVALYRRLRNVSAEEMPDPFPIAALRPSRAVPILAQSSATGASGEPRPTFWRIVWQVHLPLTPENTSLGRAKRVPVYGATVEMVVNADGRTQSLVSTARTWSGVSRTPAYSAPASHEHSERGAAASEAPLIAYVADGWDEPQTFLAPFYVVPSAEHHGTRLRPASAFSLVLDIASVPDRRGGALVVAAVMAADGTMVPADDELHEVAWSYRLFHQLPNEAKRVRGSQFTVRQTGLYHVELALKSRRTGAVRTTYRLIPVGGATVTEPASAHVH